MQLKLRHLILFVISCTLLIYANTPWGALLALAAAMQLALLIHNIELSRKSQLAAFKLFLVSIPLFLFWGGIHAFMMIYFIEKQFFLFLMAFSVTLILCFLLCLQIIFSYNFLSSSNFELIPTLQNAFNNIKKRNNGFMKSVLLLFTLSFIPWLDTDWKLVFAVMGTHLYLNPEQVKKAFLNF